MKLIGITYKGPEIDDLGTFNSLPEDLKVFLKQVNGIIAFKGGLHIRGCCIAPTWHSINEYWTGKSAFWKHYPDVLDIDVPFAEDCMGDQFLVRGNKVVKLNAETGEVDELQLTLFNFFEEMEKDPITFLAMHPLIQFEMEGGSLEPGELLSAYPPFCLNQTGEVNLKKMSATERINELSTLSKKIRGMQDGDEVQFIVG